MGRLINNQSSHLLQPQMLCVLRLSVKMSKFYMEIKKSH